MKLEEMKAIAKKRDKDFLGEAKNLWFPEDISLNKEDAEFIAMVSNNWDKLMAVMEIAKFLIDGPKNGLSEFDRIETVFALWRALEDLEKE